MQIIALAIVISAIAADIKPESALIQFGHELFFDYSVLSRDGNGSCATCHNPSKNSGYSDNLAVSVGPRGQQAGLGFLGIRNVRTLFNCSGFLNRPTDTDGRTRNLNEKVWAAITDPLVLNMPSRREVVLRVRTRPRYQELAKLAFGTPGISEERIEKALVAFLKTLDYNDLPADRMYLGLTVALPSDAIEGWPIFQRDCTVCHRPETDWRDYEYHNAGISSRSGNIDILRGGIAGQQYNYMTATPTLRGINHTPPYFHNGSVKSLEEACKHFTRGGRYKLNGKTFFDRNTDPLILAIKQTPDEEKKCIAFVKTAFQNPDTYPYKADPFKKQ